MPTKPGNKSRIEYAGLSEQVANWIFKEQLSYKDICEKLKIEHDIILTESSITNFKKMVLDQIPNFLEHNDAYREMLAKISLDTIENLMYALTKIKTRIEDFDDPKKWRQQSIFLNLLLSECQMLLKRAGEIKPSQFIKQEITNIQSVQIMQFEVVRLIDEGQIPLEGCSEQIKELYKKAKGIKA